jgi:hypothetical protein
MGGTIRVRLVKEGVIRQLGHDEAITGGLLARLQDRGQTQVGATIQGQTLGTLIAGETAGFTSAAAATTTTTTIETAILLGHIGEHLLFLKPSETGATGAQGMMSAKEGELLLVIVHGGGWTADWREWGG